MGVITLGATFNTPLKVIADGPDEAQAVDAIEKPSRDGSRRSRAVSAPVGCSSSPVRPCWPPPPAHCQSTALEVSASSGALAARLSFQWDQVPDMVAGAPPGPGVKDHLHGAPVREAQPGPSPDPDHLLAERSVSRSAFWDFLDGRYVVESDTRRAGAFPEEAAPTGNRSGRGFPGASIPEKRIPPWRSYRWREIPSRCRVSRERPASRR